MVEEIETALGTIAVREGKADAALVKALTAAEPVRRATAATALVRAGVADQKIAIRKLLQDPDASVRLRVGLALAGTRTRTRSRC